MAKTGGRAALSRPDVYAVDLRWAHDQLDIPTVAPRGVERGIARLADKLPGLVFADAALEGNTYTMPEVVTLLEGEGTAGHAVAETDQILDLAEAANLVMRNARTGPSPISKERSDAYNAILARHEGIEAGMFRGEGHALSGGTVNAMGRTFHAPAPGEGGTNLRRIFDEGHARIAQITNPLEKACTWAAFATYQQFYFDGNKRTSRYMMNEILLSHGYDSIVIPQTDRAPYNTALARMFHTGEATGYIQFLLDHYSDR
jgi:Fic family protein